LGAKESPPSCLFLFFSIDVASSAGSKLT